MELFTLRKVVDPHRNMPKKIRDLFFEAFKDESRNNDSFIDYTVVSEEEYEADEDDSPARIAFDKWMIENFEADESVILLYWW